MAIEDDNNGKTATGSWVGKGTGSGPTSANDKRQSLGTGGASDHVDNSHSGSGGEGGIGSGLGGAAEAGMRPDQGTGYTPAGTGLGASLETNPSDPSEARDGMFNDWETSNNPLIASNRVEGTAVYSQDRERLGTIHHIMIDKLSGQSEFAVMSFGGFLGIGSDYYPIPWNKLTYDTEAGGYVVDITREQLTGAPRYAADDEPDYGDDYTGQIGRHYGL